VLFGNSSCPVAELGYVTRLHDLPHDGNILLVWSGRHVLFDLLVHSTALVPLGPDGSVAANTGGHIELLLELQLLLDSGPPIELPVLHHIGHIHDFCLLFYQNE